ncbi:MAG: hypothetical protein GX683_02865 [Ruminococcaceae bacterium]|nr:hypothetical protein [Oscillospiraceae bacterium]
MVFHGVFADKKALRLSPYWSSAAIEPYLREIYDEEQRGKSVSDIWKKEQANRIESALMGVLVSVVMQGGNEGINYLSTGQTATGAEIRQKQGEYLSRTQDALVDELVNYGMTESQAVELLSGAMGDVLAQSAPMGEVRAEENAPITSLEPTLAPEATQSPQISSPAPTLTPETSSELVQIKTPQSATQAATEAENIINTVLELKNSEASAAQKAEETVGYMLEEQGAKTPDAVIHKSVTETISDSVSELSSMSPVAALS